MKNPKVLLIAILILILASWVGCVADGPAVEFAAADVDATPFPTQSVPPTSTPPPTATAEHVTIEVVGKPAIIGKTGGECDRGPTSISAAPEVASAAQPGTLLHLGPVSYLNYAANLNMMETEDCAFRHGIAPVYYTLHIRDLDELQVYGKLAKKAGDFKLDRIMQTDVAPPPPIQSATVVPTPDLQATIDAAIRNGKKVDK